ncbi:MAG: hypothetical protein J5W83_04975 [Candidatus Accumulibacter sp.]|uniref:hypothetical protein n=1 Tax=Accumulibacter sp. TaxID=2053492 RepID=UPI001B0BE271|nr:hypothetical protein [Accumulibacter sp.]MBO3701880.1 hypothetical protein [Accumulibacter sp.]
MPEMAACVLRFRPQRQKNQPCSVSLARGSIVYSRKEDRPANATAENGVAWIEWSPRGEGVDGAKNRRDFGMLMLRIMATNPSWTERPDNITKPGMEEPVMGAYYPRGESMTKDEFGARGPKR